MALPHGVVECFSTMEDILEPPLVVLDNHLPQEIVPAESEHDEEEESRLSEDDDDDERNPYLVDNPYLVAEDDDDEEDQPDLCSTRGSNDDSSLLPPPLPNRCGLILQHHQQQLQQGEQLLHQEEQQAKDEVKDDEFRSSRGATTVNTESLSESERRSFSYDERGVVVNEPPKEIRTTPSSSQRDTAASPTTNRTKSPSPEIKHDDEPVAEQQQQRTSTTTTTTPREEAKLQESNEQQHCTTPGVISVPGFVVSTAPEDIYDSSSPSNNSPNNALLNASSEESPEDVCPDSQRLVVATEVEVGIPHVDSSDLEDDHRIVFSASKAEIIYDPEEEITRRRMADELKVINNKPKNIQEKIFGNNPKRYFSNSSGNIDIAASPECIRRRDVLKWTVKRNPAVSNQWVTSVQTNQKAVNANDIVEMDRCIKNFCADSKHHATELGLAMATPLQLPFGENPICYICKNKFALLRRPCHCRNCGVCICSTCSVTWPSKMIPESYNTKSESQVNACLGCDWLATMFREALIEGRFKDAVDLYTTGNVNLRTPFCNINKKDEILYPIHAAVMGGNLPLVRWLTTNHCCPLRDTNVSNIANTTSIINTTSSTISSMTTRKSNRINRTAGPILTSKGRSALGIALDNQNMEIICFLVGERGMSFGEEKDLAHAATLVNFCMRLVRMLPPGFCENHQSATTGIENNNNKKEDETTLMDRSMDRSLRSTSNGNNNSNETFPLPLL